MIYPLEKRGISQELVEEFLNRFKSLANGSKLEISVTSDQQHIYFCVAPRESPPQIKFACIEFVRTKKDEHHFFVKSIVYVPDEIVGRFRYNQLSKEYMIYASPRVISDVLTHKELLDSAWIDLWAKDMWKELPSEVVEN